MRVSLNPINTNTKSNNSNPVNFKATAELRLGKTFFDKLAALKPEEAANRIKNIIDAATFLKKVASKIEKQDELIILTEQVRDNRWLDLFYYRRFGPNINRKTKSDPNKWLYYKDHVNVVVADGASDTVSRMTDIINNEHNARKGIVLKNGEKLPMPEKQFRYSGFIASQDGNTLRRVVYDAAYTKRIGEETTTLAELIAKLKALCTPAEQQKQLEYTGWDK